MMKKRYGKTPLFVFGPDIGDTNRRRIYLPPKSKEMTHGDHAGDIVREHVTAKWTIHSLNLKDYDETAIQRLIFDSDEEAAAFVATIYGQVRHARNASPVPEPIRAFIENEGRDLAEGGKALRSALLNHVYKARTIRHFADEYGIGGVYLRVDSDTAKMVRRVMNWKREGDEHPFFSEVTLYELIGKEDARSLLSLIDDAMKEIDPIAAADPHEESSDE
jgi:hypothetical protein